MKYVPVYKLPHLPDELIDEIVDPSTGKVVYTPSKDSGWRNPKEVKKTTGVTRIFLAFRRSILFCFCTFSVILIVVGLAQDGPAVVKLLTESGGSSGSGLGGGTSEPYSHDDIVYMTSFFRGSQGSWQELQRSGLQKRYFGVLQQL